MEGHYNQLPSNESMEHKSLWYLILYVLPSPPCTSYCSIGVLLVLNMFPEYSYPLSLTPSKLNPKSDHNFSTNFAVLQAPMDFCLLSVALAPS